MDTPHYDMFNVRARNLIHRRSNQVDGTRNAMLVSVMPCSWQCASCETEMLYFFDVRDGAELSRDDTGIDLPDPAAAKLQATLALTEMARDDLPSNGDERRLSIHVRTADGPQFDVSLDYELQVTSGRDPDT